MLNQAYTRLENAELFVHILFADLSSAFNTVQPHHMVTKMLNLVVSHRLTLWITDIMVGRVQSVKCRNDRTGLLFFFSLTEIDVYRCAPGYGFMHAVLLTAEMIQL